MFINQCGNCGERWYVGNKSTCKCPDEVEIVNNNLSVLTQEYIVCPKHGKHQHIISSTIQGHAGKWCQICWLESLGPSLTVINE